MPNRLRRCFASYAMGKLPEKRFDLLLADYEKEQAELENMIAAEQSALEVFRTDTDRADQFLALAKKYTDFTELTTPMIFEFVDKILVHAPEKIDGERTMEIDIYLKFIGKFDIPLPEPSPEELAEMEVQHDYTRKQGLVWQQVFLPEYAPAQWADRRILWNAVEENEKTRSGAGYRLHRIAEIPALSSSGKRKRSYAETSESLCRAI